MGRLAMSARPLTLLALLCVYSVKDATSQGGAELAANALHSRLAKYDRNFRPGYGGPPLEVSVRVRQLTFIENGDVRIQLGVTWQDLRLAHEVEGVEEIRRFGDRASEIWQPELVIGAGLQGVSSLMLRSNGEVELTTRAGTPLSCIPSLFSPLYPQACSLTVETLHDDPTSVVLSWTPHPPVISSGSPPHLNVLAFRQSSASPSSQLTISVLTQVSFLPLFLTSYLSHLLLLLLSLLSLFLPPSLSSPRLLLSLLPLLLLAKHQETSSSLHPWMPHQQFPPSHLQRCYCS